MIWFVVGELCGVIVVLCVLVFGGFARLDLRGFAFLFGCV